MEEKKVYYTNFCMDIIGTDLPKAHIMADGRVQSVKPKTIRLTDRTTGEVKEQEAAEVRIKATLGDKTVAKYFGNEFVNDYHSVYFSVTYTGYAAKNILDYPPDVDQIVTVCMKSPSVNSYTSTSGKAYHSVQGWGYGNVIRRSARKEDGQSALSNAEQGGSRPAPASDHSSPSAPAPAYSGFSGKGTFSEFEDDDDDLPF